MKNLSNEKTTSDKGSISALDCEVFKVELTKKINISKNEQTCNEEKEAKKKTKKKKKKEKSELDEEKLEETKKIGTDQDNNAVGEFDDALKLNEKSNAEAGKVTKVWIEKTKLGYLRRNHVGCQV